MVVALEWRVLGFRRWMDAGGRGILVRGGAELRGGAEAGEAVKSDPIALVDGTTTTSYKLAPSSPSLSRSRSLSLSLSLSFSLALGATGALAPHRSLATSPATLACLPGFGVAVLAEHVTELILWRKARESELGT